MKSGRSLIMSGRSAVPSLALTALMSLLPARPAAAGCDRLFADPISYPTGAKPVGMVAGDFNEDGIADLAAANLSGGTISILLGRGASGVGDGTFWTHVTYAMGGTPLFALAIAGMPIDKLPVEMIQQVIADGLAADAAGAAAWVASQTPAQIAAYLRSKSPSALLLTLLTKLAALGLAGSGPIPDGAMLPADPIGHASHDRFRKK